MPGVTITGLTKHYGDVGAVKGLDLRVEPGELDLAVFGRLCDEGRRAGWLKIYWMTQEDNVAARKLYDAIAVRSPLVRYDLQLAPH